MQSANRKGFFSISKAMINFTIDGLGTHLFVKVPQPSDSKVTFSVFESSCHLLPLV